VMHLCTGTSGGGELADRRIRCPVDEADVPALPGKEINAFRILPETGRGYFLDFIHYSPADQRAEVVHRLRVHEDALESMQERLSSDLFDVHDEDITITGHDIRGLN